MPNSLLILDAEGRGRQDAWAVLDHTMTPEEAGERWVTYANELGHEVGEAYLRAYDAAGGIR